VVIPFVFAILDTSWEKAISYHLNLAIFFVSAILDASWEKAISYHPLFNKVMQIVTGFITQKSALGNREELRLRWSHPKALGKEARIVATKSGI